MSEQDDIPTMVDCPRCKRWGPSRTCALCTGARMCLPSAAAAWEARTRDSGEYEFVAPPKED